MSLHELISIALDHQLIFSANMNNSPNTVGEFEIIDDDISILKDSKQDDQRKPHTARKKVRYENKSRFYELMKLDDEVEMEMSNGNRLDVDYHRGTVKSIITFNQLLMLYRLLSILIR